jgi:predicted XRE-type DNA-binding protein
MAEYLRDVAAGRDPHTFMPMQRTEQELAEIITACSINTNEKGCWLWTGKLNSTGYGTLGGLNQSGTHRVSYRVFIGDPGTKMVLHKCDVRNCCNPEHLWLGTREDNMQDCAKKGRNGSTLYPERRPRGSSHWTKQPGVKLVGQRGEKCSTSKLTSRQVEQLRALYKTGNITQKQLGIQFGISQSQVGRIVRGERWAHL